jgi:hypothetical protein
MSGPERKRTPVVPRPELAAWIAVACLLATSGCEPKRPDDPDAYRLRNSDVEGGRVFEAPAPQGAADDPRVAGPASTGDAISASLYQISSRLNRLEGVYEAKAWMGGDLGEVAARMRPLVETARADCDAIKRAATDLKVQLPIAQVGYGSAAASYRQRADGYKDRNLKEVTLKLADNFDRLAADTSRRLDLTERFLKRLGDLEGFLAETERFLRDAEAALAVFSGGGKMPQISPDGRGLTRKLGEFITVVREYEDKLLERPTSPPVDAVPKPAAGGVGRASEGGGRKGASAAPLRTLEGELAAMRGKQAGASAVSVGARFEGAVDTPSRGFRGPVSFEVVGRAGDEVTGVMTYSGGLGSRGLRGRISGDGRSLVLWAEWWRGDVQPDQIRYELTVDGGRLSGPWSTATVAGTVALEASRTGEQSESYGPFAGP